MLHETGGTRAFLTMIQIGGGDPKTSLNQFLQKHLQRPVTKTDITYQTNKFGQQFQSIVKLVCLGGLEYAGHLETDAKLAERSAAQQALEAHGEEIAKLNEVAFQSKKRKIASPEELAAKRQRSAEAAAAGELNPAVTPKTQLNSLCMKIAKRYLQKGETAYECVKIGDVYQATVKLSCLPGEWQGKMWRGEAAPNRQKAEQNAAEEALKDIEADPEMAEEAAKPKGAGKGSKGWGKPWWPPMMMGGWKGGWGMGGGGASLPRERVTETVVTGEVLEWKGSYGWIKPHAELEHPQAHRRGGKIYAHKKDLSPGLEELAEGLTVSFHIYEDPSGLGAEEVMVA